MRRVGVRDRRLAFGRCSSVSENVAASGLLTLRGALSSIVKIC